jgi:hypothetical protein
MIKKFNEFNKINENLDDPFYMLMGNTYRTEDGMYEVYFDDL